MAFTSGQWGPDTFFDSAGNTELIGATVSAVGYVCVVDAFGNLTVTGPAIDSLTVTVTPASGAAYTATIKVPPLVAELDTVRGLAVAAETVAGATAKANAAQAAAVAAAATAASSTYAEFPDAAPTIGALMRASNAANPPQFVWTTTSALVAETLAWFNVKDYGAVGDGVTDDTTAIRAAMTAAGLVKGTVWFPPGTYKVTGRLNVPLSVSIAGAGSDSSIIDASTVTNDSILIGPGNNTAATWRGFRLNLCTAGNAPAPTNKSYASFCQQHDFLANGHGRIGYVIGASFGLSANRCIMQDVVIYGGSVGLVSAQAMHLTYISVRCAESRTNCYVIDDGKSSAAIDPVSGDIITHQTLMHINCLYQVVNASGSALVGEEPANVRIAAVSAPATTPRGIVFQTCYFDEPAYASNTGLISNVDVVEGVDIAFRDCNMHSPTGPGGSVTRYTMRIRAGVRRLKLDGVTMNPYVMGDANRRPTQTLIIESGARDVTLTDLTTTPDGGGDILDNGTRTVRVNVNGFSTQLPLYTTTRYTYDGLDYVDAGPWTSGVAPAAAATPPSSGVTTWGYRFKLSGTGGDPGSSPAVYKVTTPAGAVDASGSWAGVGRIYLQINPTGGPLPPAPRV